MSEQIVPPPPAGPPPAGAPASGNGNGSLLRRVERLEDVTAEVKERMIRYETRDDFWTSQMLTKADLAQLATKADLAALGATTKADLAALGATTKADLAALGATTKADLAALEAKLLGWFIGTAITLTGLIFAITKFGNA